MSVHHFPNHVGEEYPEALPATPTAVGSTLFLLYLLPGAAAFPSAQPAPQCREGRTLVSRDPVHAAAMPPRVCEGRPAWTVPSPANRQRAVCTLFASAPWTPARN